MLPALTSLRCEILVSQDTSLDTAFEAPTFCEPLRGFPFQSSLPLFPHSLPVFSPVYLSRPFSLPILSNRLSKSREMLDSSPFWRQSRNSGCSLHKAQENRTAQPCTPTMNWVKAEVSGFLLPLISCVLWACFKNSLGLSITLCSGSC